jgi:tetratricopeptide (TPR) repeat protein
VGLRRLHLFGDSVFEGSVTDIADDKDDALRELQSPAAIMNLAAGRPFARLAGATGFPDNVEAAAAGIEAQLAAGQIVPGDTVVLLDVGPHAMDTARHEADWLRLRRAATAAHDVRLVMCGGFDNGGRGLRNLVHEAPLDGRSPNDAVRAAAIAPGDFAGDTHFLELAAPLKSLHGRLAGSRRSAFLVDGVHLTVWGQICLALLVLRATGVRAAGFGRLVEAVRRNWKPLAAASELHALSLLAASAQTAGLRSVTLQAGLLRARAGRTLGALGVRRRSGSSDDPGPELESLLGEADRLATEGRLEEALERYRAAAARDPACVAAQQGRTTAAALLGKSAEVIEAGRTALALEPKGGKYYVWLSRAMILEGADPDMVAWLDALAETNAPVRAYKDLAALLAALGDAGRAEVWRRRAEAAGRVGD